MHALDFAVAAVVMTTSASSKSWRPSHSECKIAISNLILMF